MSDTQEYRWARIAREAEGYYELGLHEEALERAETLLEAGKLHHVVAIADVGPRIITFVIDGVLCNGGTERDYGWGRWHGRLAGVSGSGELQISSAVKRLRIYNRYLRTSEAVASYHEGNRL